MAKFVSILVKEEIMKSYLRTKNLVLSDITDVNISSRVYLNNMYPPTSQRLMAYCRKLKKSGLIKRFTINHSNGSAKLCKLDDSLVDVSNFEELMRTFSLPAGTDA